MERSDARPESGNAAFVGCGSGDGFELGSVAGEMTAPRPPGMGGKESSSAESASPMEREREQLPSVCLARGASLGPGGAAWLSVG